MKQPVNEIQTFEANNGSVVFIAGERRTVRISHGKTELAALKQAKRRLEKLTRDIDKMIRKGK